MKKISIVLLVVIMAVSLAACGRNTGTSSDQQNSNEEQLTGKHHVVIAVKDYGNISVELDADAAPITVTNFVTLAKSGFYDGLTFHRIISGFMIQGGDPLGDCNKLTHKRGAISMARSSSNNSASSQFFIVHKDSRYLDGKYACFGYVTDGMDVVDKICQNVKPVDDNGKVNKGDQPVIEKITVVD